MKDVFNHEKFSEREDSTTSVLHPVKNEHNFEAKFFIELGSYMYTSKSHNKILAKRSGAETTSNSKKEHQKSLLAVVMRQKMHFY